MASTQTLMVYQSNSLSEDYELSSKCQIPDNNNETFSFGLLLKDLDISAWQVCISIPSQHWSMLFRLFPTSIHTTSSWWFTLISESMWHVEQTNALCHHQNRINPTEFYTIRCLSRKCVWIWHWFRATIFVKVIMPSRPSDVNMRHWVR